MIIPMLKPRPSLWGIAAFVLIVLTAGISAGVAKGSLPGPGWFGAGVVTALATAAAMLAALKPVFVKVVQVRVDRSLKQSEAGRELRERLGGPNGKFPRVSNIRDRALRYGVQQAIPLDGDTSNGLSADMPRYLPRTVDGRLRSSLTARSATGGMVIVKGNSTWGKSRSMFEAVGEVLGGWQIVAPRKAGDVRDLLESGLPLKQTVVWLDELVDFVTGDGPMTCDVVQRAVDKGAILVGTIWKDDFAALTDPPKKALGGRAVRSPHDAGLVDEHGDARAILTATYADIIEMPHDLDEEEAAVASALAKQDSRWAHALADAGELSPIQVLAAAPQLLHRYRSPDHEAGGVVLRTAVALLAAEHPPPVPSGLLRRAAQAAMPPTMELSDDWFEEALAWACRPVRGKIAPLQPFRNDASDDPGVVAPDLLVSAVREAGGLQDQIDLDLTLAHATAEACADIGGYFYFRDEDDVAEPFLRRAAECGIVRAFRQYGYVLGEQVGRAAEAEAWYRKSADAGDAGAMAGVGYMLSKQDGRAAEAEVWFRKAIDAGEPAAMTSLGYLLSEQEGRAGEAEAWLRKAMDAGEPDLMFSMGVLLSKQGRATEAEEWYRKAAIAGEPGAMFGFAYVLGEQEGRTADAEEFFRALADAGNVEAMLCLGLVLEDQEGRAGEAESWYRKAAEAGESDSMLGLGQMLAKQEGRAAEAEVWFRKAIDAGEPAAMTNLGYFLIGRDGRAAEAEEWFRKALDAEAPAGLNNLGDALTQLGKYVEARSILERGIATGDPYAMRMMGELDLLEGHREAGRTWLRKAASLGVDAAAEILAEEFGEDPAAG